MPRCVLASRTPHFDRFGNGPSLLFQHGLGASCQQARDLLSESRDIAVLAPDAPGHGASDDWSERYSFDAMADTAVALLDHLNIATIVAGGISMGASIAINLALRYPERVRGLVLVRPAWLFESDPPHLRIIADVGRWLDADGVDTARRRLASDPFHAELHATNPGSAASIAGLFDRPGAEHRGRVLWEMVADAPCRSAAELARIDLPALVVATEEDPLHPTTIARQLADTLPRASFQTTPPRYIEPERHARVVRELTTCFVRNQGAGADA